MAVVVCARGDVDPVQDDEGNAAKHDHESAEQEGGGLCGRGGVFRSHDMFDDNTLGCY